MGEVEIQLVQKIIDTSRDVNSLRGEKGDYVRIKCLILFTKVLSVGATKSLKL